MSFAGKLSQEKWQDIVKEIKFLRECTHENMVQYNSSYLKGEYVWVSAGGRGRTERVAFRGEGGSGGLAAVDALQHCWQCVCCTMRPRSLHRSW